MLGHTESARNRKLVSDGMLVALTFGSLFATVGSLVVLGGPFDWEEHQLPYVRASALVSTIALIASGRELARRASR
jgi:hypothetical protein